MQADKSALESLKKTNAFKKKFSKSFSWLRKHESEYVRYVVNGTKITGND